MNVEEGTGHWNHKYTGTHTHMYTYSRFPQPHTYTLPPSTLSHKYTHSHTQHTLFHTLTRTCPTLSHTLLRHEEVDRLQGVQIELILAILDPLSPPADLPSHLASDLLLLLGTLKGVPQTNAQF